MDQNRLMKVSRIALAAALVAHAGLFLSLPIGTTIKRHTLQQEAEESVNRARDLTHPQTTMDDAERWLQQNGFGHIISGHGMRDPSKEAFYAAVLGTRQLCEKGLFAYPTWVRVEFVLRCRAG